MKADISDHFLILFVAKVNIDVNIKTKQYILNRNISDQSIRKFKQKLSDITWDDIRICDTFSHSLKRFLHFIYLFFFSLYNECLESKDKNQIKPTKTFSATFVLKVAASSSHQ